MLHFQQQLQLFRNATFLPLTLVDQKHRILAQFGTSPLPQDYLEQLLNKVILGEKQGHSPLLIEENFLLTALVTLEQENYSVLVGPIFSRSFTQEEFNHLLLEKGISHRYRQSFIDYFQGHPTISQEQLFFSCQLLKQFLEKQTVEDSVQPTPFLPSQDDAQHFQQLHTKRAYDEKEQEFFHNTYNFEKQLYHYVQRGDISQTDRLLAENVYLQAGNISLNSLRQEQIILITSIALIARYSIEGGLPIEEAYQLSDSYIQQSEKATEVNTVKKLSEMTIYDFANRVKQSQIPKHLSPTIIQALQYIQSHTNQAISTTDIAKAVNRSRTYLSRQFKKELGTELTQYINFVKIEEAKHLLQYTDLTLSEISASLCFSSQSYFQKVFKAHVGQTPKQYKISHSTNFVKIDYHT